MGAPGTTIKNISKKHFSIILILKSSKKQDTLTIDRGRTFREQAAQEGNAQIAAGGEMERDIMHKEITVSDSVKGAAAYLGYVIATVPSAAWGQTDPQFEALAPEFTISSAIVNASQSIPMVLDLIFAGSFLIGLVLIVKALFMIVDKSDGKREVSWPAIVMHFVVASIFISSVQSMDVGMSTLDASGISVLSYTPPRPGLAGSVNVDTCIVLQAILGFIILFGWIGFLRGWWMLKAAVEGGGQHTQGNAYVFIVGGVLAANVCWTHAVLVATLRVDFMNIMTQGAGCGCS
jgi:hypothetical protein